MGIWWVPVTQMSRPGAYEKRNVEVCNDYHPMHHMRCNTDCASNFTCVMT